jgi:RHS repeat-associated protein
LNQRVRIAPTRGTYEFVWDIFGRRVSNWAAYSHSFVESNAYTDWGPIAARGGGATEFEHQNWLGTERLRTSYNGAVVISIASLPWADGHTPSGDNGDQHDFAQMDRDLEDNTEHAQYRQYSTNLGRWLGPDQYTGSYDFTNPQSFNRYAYALNDPVNMLDPSGLRACQYAGGGCNGQQGGGDDDSAYYVDGVQVNAALASTIINLDGGLSFFFELGSTNSAPVGNGLGPYTMQTNVSGLEVDLDPFGFIIPSSSSSVGFVDPGVAPNNTAQNWKKDLNAVKTCASGSAGSAAAGTGLLAAGSNVISTAGKFAGSTPGTSLASQFFRTILPQSIDATWAPTLMNPLATSSSLGGVVGRWVPIAGEGLLLYSGVKFLNCVSDNGDGFW